jgi:hypothetical protein
MPLMNIEHVMKEILYKSPFLDPIKIHLKY